MNIMLKIKVLQNEGFSEFLLKARMIRYFISNIDYSLDVRMNTFSQN